MVSDCRVESHPPLVCVKGDYTNYDPGRVSARGSSLPGCQRGDVTKAFRGDGLRIIDDSIGDQPILEFFNAVVVAQKLWFPVLRFLRE